MSVACIEEDASPYVAIGERPEWADLQPRLPPILPHAVIDIARDQQFGDLMDYFWAAVDTQELSERVLSLTEEIIVELNSSNYTVWEWRWRCIQALGGITKHVRIEEELMQRVVHDNPKNYQLWNHRRRFALARGIQHAEEELEFAAESLAFDAKNYHAWAHRQAILAAFAERIQGMWLRELAFTERHIRDDVRNNSAWNHRYFVVSQASQGCLAGTSIEIYSREVLFATTKIRLAPHSESGWTYLRALAQLPGSPPHAVATDPKWTAISKEVLVKTPCCIPACSFLADIYVEKALLLRAVCSAEFDKTGPRNAASKASRLASDVFEHLCAVDPSHIQYYKQKAAKLLHETQ